MKKHHAKVLLLLIATILLLTSVGGTVAYLMDKADEMTQTFAPAAVATRIVESAGADGRSIQICNEGTIPVYVRAAVIGNWVVNQDGVEQVAAPWTGTLPLGSGWFQGADGFCYYAKPLPAEDDPATKNLREDMTPNLLAGELSQENAPEGAQLVLQVLHQSIQAEGTNEMGERPAEEAWQVSVDASGWLRSGQ